MSKLLLQITLKKWHLLESQTQRELADWLAVMSYPAQHSDAEIRVFSSIFCVQFSFSAAKKASAEPFTPGVWWGVCTSQVAAESKVAFVPLACNEPKANTFPPQRHCALLLYYKPHCSIFLSRELNWHFGLACA